MYCPRLDHFVVIDNAKKVKLCTVIGKGSFNHLQFESYQEMIASEWYKAIKQQFENGEWPADCLACHELEDNGLTSLRQLQINNDKAHSKPDYLVAEVMIDNICNGGCQTCHPQASTLIGSLSSKKYLEVNNMQQFLQLPQDRLVQLDLVGGEPTASANCKQLLANLPENISKIRVMTNGTRILPGIELLHKQGIEINISFSLDAVGKWYEYVRWPVKWDLVFRNLMTYKNDPRVRLMTWTTVSALNVNDLDNVFALVKEHNIFSSFMVLSWPTAFDPRKTNTLTLAAKEKYRHSSDERLQEISKLIAVGENNQDELDSYIKQQDNLRKIHIRDYM